MSKTGSLFAQKYTNPRKGVCHGTFEKVLQFYGRHGDLIKHYEVALSQMLHDFLGHDHMQ